MRLAGSPIIYRSDQSIDDWSIQRDGSVTTTAELPPGTRAEDIAAIIAYRVPVGRDSGGNITITAIRRAFFLGSELPATGLVHHLGRRCKANAIPALRRALVATLGALSGIVRESSQIHHTIVTTDRTLLTLCSHVVVHTVCDKQCQICGR